MAYPVSINTLKAKINIAKTQLGMDEDTYRAVLNNATGKISLKAMSFPDLMMVVHAMEQRGFKAKKPVNKQNKRYSKPAGQTAYSRKPQDKILAMWITMHKQGFINDSSETALDKFINRQTAQMGMFAVTSLRFLSPQQASRLLEMLKKWHIRVIEKALNKKEPMPYLELVEHFDAHLAKTNKESQ